LSDKKESVPSYEEAVRSYEDAVHLYNWITRGSQYQQDRTADKPRDHSADTLNDRTSGTAGNAKAFRLNMVQNSNKKNGKTSAEKLSGGIQ